MSCRRELVFLDEALSKSPALLKLAEMAEQIAGIKLVAIMADKDGWRQVRIGEASQTSQFCRMMQGSRDGVRHCHTKHLLMMASAGSEGMSEHTCHAGPQALVAPITKMPPNSSALISTCMFTSRSRARAWQAAHARGIELGLDIHQLRAAFDTLPVLPPKKLQQVRSIMATASEVMAEIKARFDAEKKLTAQSSESGLIPELRVALVREVTNGPRAPQIQGLSSVGHKQGPALIRAVVTLIERKPGVRYSAATIAAAARITPNHFCTLFHRWTGQRFLEFLTAQRIIAAQGLLQNVSLTIGEVADRTGFDDANYFARRFKQATGLTPRAWRNSLPITNRKSLKAKTGIAWHTAQSLAHI